MGYHILYLQHIILTLRNRTIHKCVLTNVWNVSEINIELISLKDAEVKSRTEHYPAGIDVQGTYNIGLVNNRHFINDTTELIAYSLDHYDEVKDIGDCHLICKKTDKYCDKDKSGTRLIKAFQLFRILKIRLESLLPPCL